MTDRPPLSRLSVPDSSGPAGTATANNDHARHRDEGEDAADRLNPHVAAAVVDIFVYVVVLNLFVEYLPGVLSETFTLSLVTAVLLKGVLEIVLAVKNRVKVRFRQASTLVGKVVAAVILWVVLVGSKFLVLEAVAFVFSDRVSLGGFVSVTLLILALLLSRAAVRRLLHGPRSAQRTRAESPRSSAAASTRWPRQGGQSSPRWVDDAPTGSG